MVVPDFRCTIDMTHGVPYGGPRPTQGLANIVEVEVDASSCTVEHSAKSLFALPAPCRRNTTRQRVLSAVYHILSRERRVLLIIFQR